MLLACALAPLNLTGAVEPDSPSRPPRASTAEVINFALIDHQGLLHELRRAEGRAIVLFFTGNGCPIARQSIGKLRAFHQRYAERGVTVWMINSNSQDDRDSIRQEAETFRSDPLPILKDDTQGVARFLDVERTCETIAISTKDWRIFYRGAIDDQLTEGAIKPQPTEKFLETALEEFLAGKAIARPQTVTKGCRISFEAEADPARAPVSFVKEVAPILIAKCVGCHSPNNVGSWAMTGHQKVKGMSAMIQEVILARRMPPWGADPHVGKFSNDRSLSVTEAQTLLRWIEQGAPRGEGDDPLPAAARPPPDWPMGPPDYVLRLPAPEHIPANGVIDLRHRILAPSFTNDVWVGAVDVKPGNRQVLHHLTVRTINPGQTVSDLGGFTGWAPGYDRSRRFPEGTAKKVAKGAKFHLELHYVTIGTPQTDQTEIAFYLLPSAPRYPLQTRVLWDAGFSIPPGEPNLKTSVLGGFDQDTMLFDLTPHMHFRGSWFKYELLLPDGTRETLLSVPRYDFNWQTIYVLAEPRRVPAGAWMLCSGGFDNSARNPTNPDPARRVRWGEQSWDEMFVGAFGVAPAKQESAETPK